MGSQFGIGERLRSERIRRKRSIDDISRETRIAPRMLEAIEKEEFSSLPGLLFARNFVKQYALALGLVVGGSRPLSRARLGTPFTYVACGNVVAFTVIHYAGRFADNFTGTIVIAAVLAIASARR